MQLKICSICHKEKGLDEFIKDKHTADGLQPECIACVEQMRKEWYKAHGYPPKIAKKLPYRENSKQRKISRKDKWLNFIRNIKATPLYCEHCGYDKYFSVLQFHHRNPTKKKFLISVLMRLKYNKKNQQIMAAELQKCIVLCANCHIELHADIRNAKKISITEGV